LELLAEEEHSAGQVTDVVAAEFGISQPTVSGHLRILRENGFASVRREGTKRLYAVESAPLQEVDRWLEGFRRFWSGPLDALATEIARGSRRDIQSGGASTPGPSNEGDRR
jgi:DNA-binding transcriptional ArsR family regulator